MGSIADLRLERRFAELGDDFFDPVEPAEFPQASLRWRNDRIAARIGLDGLDDAAWIETFGRFSPLAPEQGSPLALRYHGHQFRTYNPELGDGRGFLLAQARELGSGRLLDLGTKGSGRTPWSRSADGRLTLKGAVREALASEMLEALGVPTSKTLSVIETGESLSRHDEPSPTRGAVLTRLSHSHIRFGTFQRPAYFDRADLVERLRDHVIDYYYPELRDAADRTVALLSAVVERTATLAARWTAAGFVHGVLNTDNMSITGESFDYGPYRFLPAYDPGFTAAYFDEYGLYAFGQQAEACFWNLQQLAGCLALISEPDPLVDALNGFGLAWGHGLGGAIRRRFGLEPREAQEERTLASKALTFLREGGEALRFEPLFFDWFGGEAAEPRALRSARSAVYRGEAFDAFREALARFSPVPGAGEDAYFQQAEPEELLYDEIEALWSKVAAADDWEPLQRKLLRIGEARKAYAIAVP